MSTKNKLTTRDTRIRLPLVHALGSVQPVTRPVIAGIRDMSSGTGTSSMMVTFRPKPYEDSNNGNNNQNAHRHHDDH